MLVRIFETVFGKTTGSKLRDCRSRLHAIEDQEYWIYYRQEGKYVESIDDDDQYFFTNSRNEATDFNLNAALQICWDHNTDDCDYMMVPKKPDQI